MKIELPFPPRELNPNARSHWAVVARNKTAVRGGAKLLTRSAMNRLGIASAAFEGDFPIPIQVTFYPPDKRRRDDDNMVAAFKAARDGIADALCVDDRRFRPHYLFEDGQAPGRVEVIVNLHNPRNAQTGFSHPDSDGIDGLPPSIGEAA